jgi:hypothetical protein
MAGLAETWSNIEMRSVIRFLRLKVASPAEIRRQLVEVYGANVMSRKHVWVWCTAFDNGRTDVQDEQRSGRPSTSTSDDNVCRIEGLIQENRRIRLRDIADELNISVGTVHSIVHEQLGFRKVCSRWVPNQLTEVHKSAKPHAWVVTALQLGGTGPSSLQPWPVSEWFSSLWTIEEAPGWKAIRNRRWSSASRHVLASGAWHLFILCWDRCPGVPVGQMLRHVWGLCGKIICSKAVLLTIRVYIIWIHLRNKRTCYLIYWTALVAWLVVLEGKLQFSVWWNIAFIMKYSVEHKLFIYDIFVDHSSWMKCRRKFCRKYHDSRVPCKAT